MKTPTPETHSAGATTGPSAATPSTSTAATTNPQTQKTYTYAFIFGLHPLLSFGELQAVARSRGMRDEASALKRFDATGWMRTKTPIDAEWFMSRLGGTVKIVEVIGDFDDEKIADWLLERANPDTKFNYGFSLYPLNQMVATKKYWNTLQTLGLSLKRAFKEEGLSARFVSSKEVVLSSVIVHKERLLKNGAEICLFSGGKGKLQFGVTLAVQPFQEFSKRDYGRPQPDAKSGMLPPKLARMLVNLAEPKRDSVLYDPFCGSGTVLQEALLLGYTKVLGSDKSDKAVKDTIANLKWQKFEKQGDEVFVADATKVSSLGKIKAKSVDRIVFEGNLGPTNPGADRVPHLLQEMKQLYASAFRELKYVLGSDGRIVAALPFWHIGGGAGHDVMIDVLAVAQSAGMRIEKEYFYRRPQSTVGRHILILKPR